jgi:hypothetical protein
MQRHLLTLAALALVACRADLADINAPSGGDRLVPSAALVVNEPDALAISTNIQATHTPFGSIIDPMYGSGDPESADYMTLVGYNHAGDAAIWTGHYLAAESYRYRVTGSAGALANVQRTLDAIDALTTVSGTGVLARFAAPASSPWTAGIVTGEAGHGIYEGTWNGETHCWLGNTSRDQYTGVFFGLSVAYESADGKMKRQIRDIVTRMLDFLIANGWNVVMPPKPTLTVCPEGTAYDVGSTTFLQRPDQRLAFLQIGRQVNPSRFGALYRAERAAFAATVALPIMAECQDTHGSYYKFNLDHANLFHLVRLEETTSPFRSLYVSAYDVLRGCTGSHQNAHFNMVDRVLRGPDAVRDEETRALLGLWLERPRRDYYKNLRGQYLVCDEREDRSCIPIAVDDRVNTDFLWQRSPFQLSGGRDGTIETAGIDYILPYWMGRFYGTVGG